MPYKFIADSITQRIFVADFVQVKCNFTLGKRSFCIFELPVGGFRGNVRHSFRLIVEPVVDFLLC